MVESVEAIPDAANAFEVLVIDLDNTLVSYARPAPAMDRLWVRIQILAERLDLSCVCVLSNSRLPIAPPPRGTGVVLSAVTRARKPWTSRKRIACSQRTRLNPFTAAVVGDQVLTDGVLAAHLGVPFYQVISTLPNEPMWPRIMRHAGERVASWLFEEEEAL